MQSSGEAGVIVVSFGSMVTHLTGERAEVVAAALGRVRQKVGVTPGGERTFTPLRDDVVDSSCCFVLRSSGDTAERLHKHCQRTPSS